MQQGRCKSKPLFIMISWILLCLGFVQGLAHAAQDSTVRVATRAAFSGTFDPIKNLSTQEPYLKPIYETLVTLGQDGNLQPLLATSWKHEGLTYSFALRKGVTFQDGSVFDANAVVEHFMRGKSTPGPYAAFFANVKSVTATGDSNVSVVLNRPYPSFLLQITSIPGMIESPKASQKPDFAQKPVGTAPWVLNEDATRRGSVVVYREYPGYWDKSQQGVGRIEVYQYASEAAKLNSLKSGRIDVAEIQGDQVEETKAAGMNVDVALANRWVAFGFFDMEGKLVPAFGDRRVRNAMMMAIDRKTIAEKLYFGYAVPSVQPYAKDHWAHVPGLDEAFPYDPQQARRLLAEAGYASGFEFTVPSSPLFKEINEAMAGYLAQVGIKMNVEMVAGSLYAAAKTKKYPGWLVSFPSIDPDDYPAKHLNEKGPGNFFAWSSPKLEKLAEKTFAAPVDDLSVRGPAYRDWIDYAVREGYFVGLVIPQQLRATSRRVKRLLWPKGAPYFEYRGLKLE